MISLEDVYHVITATVPLYVTMILAYVSVKWWKIFTPEQCSGINKFVAKFSVPLLSFQVISSNNFYKMSLKLMYADFVQKLLAFLALTIIIKVSGRGGLKWIITGLSLSTLPNTLILGIPLMKAMYRDDAALLLPQIIVLQSLIWYNLLLFLHELDAAIPARTMPDTPPPPPPPSQAIGETENSQELQPKEEEEEDEEAAPAGRDRKKKIMLILMTVGRELITNPNTHATLIGLIWSCIHFRWGVNLPDVINQSITILSNGGLGMAAFSLGLFMASRSSIIACGPRMTMVALGLKFLAGPALMALASLMIGLKGTSLKVAIVQAALPQGIVPFVFAKEYNVNPSVLSTGVLLGMLVALPVALTYYLMLSL